MSLSNALSNALSGIVAASRGTEVVSTNLANALTPGFARRELQLSARPYVSAGGGVHIDGVARMVRNTVLAQTRIASAESARTGTLAAFHAAASDKIGVPGEAGALSTLLAGFDAALVSAAGRPDNEANLTRVANQGQQLASALNALGREAQGARTVADRAIADDVRALNDGLQRVTTLNRQISVQLATGQDATALQDTRQRIIDELGRIVPLQELPREGGRIALFTTGGAALLDGSQPMRFDFQAAGPFAPGMQAGTPPVGTLSINGEPATEGQMEMFAGGRMAANFRIRDSDAPALQAALDTVARDLVDRLADPSIDPTLAAGQAAFFTDAGGPVVAGQETGLTQRLTVNAALLPPAGGDVWRIRDGINAATPGPAGDGALLDRMRAALKAERSPTLAGMGMIARNAATLAGDLASRSAAGRLDAEAAQAAAQSQTSAFEAAMRQDGVDSDKEMETLLSLERAYASNARVLQAVDDMIQTILRLS